MLYTNFTLIGKVFKCFYLDGYAKNKYTQYEVQHNI